MSRFNLFARIIVTGLLYCTALPAGAAIIVHYEGDDVAGLTQGANSNAATTSFPSITASNLTSSTTLGYDTSADVGTLTPSRIPAFTMAGINQPTATNFFTFTLTPDASFALDATSLDFYSRFGSTANSPNQRMYRVEYTIGANSAVVARPDTIFNTAVYTPITVPLSLSGVTDPITFRIYGFNATDPATTFRVDDVIINGSVAAVPEPGTLALAGLGLGMLGVGMLRRRQR